MKRFLLLIPLLLLGSIAEAQTTTVPATVTINYTLPTANTDQTVIPATGPVSLAKLNVWILPNSTTGTPTVTPTAVVTSLGTTTTQTTTLPLGGTAFIRIQACNVAGVCSDATNEVTAPINAPKPGMPTNIVVTIKVG